MNSTSLFQTAIFVVDGFQSVEPCYFFNLADFLCAFTAAFTLRYRYKSSVYGLSLAIATFLMCFGGSSITNFMHGLMMGYLRRTTGFTSYFCGLYFLTHSVMISLCIAVLPQSLIDSVFPTSLFQQFHFIVEAFLRVHCVTSWGADTAINNHGSVVSATLSSMATGCGGGVLATILLDSHFQGSLMSKLTRVLYSRKSELEHLLTMSLFYQIAIGFIPLSFIQPIDPLAAKTLCFTLFLGFKCVESLTGIRLFIPLPLEEQEKEKEESFVCINTRRRVSYEIFHQQHTYILKESNT